MSNQPGEQQPRLGQQYGQQQPPQGQPAAPPQQGAQPGQAPQQAQPAAPQQQQPGQQNPQHPGQQAPHPGQQSPQQQPRPQQPQYGQPQYGAPTQAQPYGQPQGQSRPGQQPYPNAPQAVNQAAQAAQAVNAGIGAVFNDTSITKSLTGKIASPVFWAVTAFTILHAIGAIIYDFTGLKISGGGADSSFKLNIGAGLFNALAQIVLCAVIILGTRVVLELAINVEKIARKRD